MKNGKCRMHGGASTGARTPEGRARIVAARTIHGGYGAESRAFQAKVAGIKRRGRVLCAFAATGLSFEDLAPLIRQAQAIEPARPSKGNTPCAQGIKAGGPTAEAMRALMTMDLTSRQATSLTRLIRSSAPARASK